MSDGANVIEMLSREGGLQAWVRQAPTLVLRLLWKSSHLNDDDPGCFIAEAIHAEMNRRGFGEEVAV